MSSLADLAGWIRVSSPYQTGSVSEILSGFHGFTLRRSLVARSLLSQLNGKTARGHHDKCKLWQ